MNDGKTTTGIVSGEITRSEEFKKMFQAKIGNGTMYPSNEELEELFQKQLDDLREKQARVRLTNKEEKIAKQLLSALARIEKQKEIFYRYTPSLLNVEQLI